MVFSYRGLPSSTSESFGEPFFYFVKIGIFSFDIAQQAKQGGIRVEFLQTLRNGIVLYRTDRQYIFYQNLCRLAIVHCQFLHSGKAVGANIFAQQLIVSQNRIPSSFCSATVPVLKPQEAKSIPINIVRREIRSFITFYP